MAAITTTAVERFIRSGVPTGKPHASFRDGSGPVPAPSAHGAASWQFIYRVRGAGRRERRRPLRSARGLRSTCARRPRKPGAWRAKSLQARSPRRHQRDEAPRARRRGGGARRLREMDQGRRLRKVADDDVGAAAGLGPSLATRPCGPRSRGPDRRDRADRAQRQARRGAGLRKHLRTFLNRQFRSA